MKFKNNEIFQLFDKITCPGVYFLMNCDLKTNAIPTLLDEYRRDKDIIQKYIVADTEESVSCPQSYDEELLPPAERPSVQELIKMGRRPPKFRKIFKDKTGLDYYPFKR